MAGGYTITLVDSIIIYKAGVPIRLSMQVLKDYVAGTTYAFTPVAAAQLASFPLTPALDGTEFTEINIGSGMVPYTLASLKAYVLGAPTTSQIGTGTVYPALTDAGVVNMRLASVYYWVTLAELKTFLTS